MLVRGLLVAGTMRRVTPLLVALVLSACVTVPLSSPPLPRRPSDRSTKEERLATYRSFRLRRCGEETLVRADGSYPFTALKDVVGDYPRSRAIYERAAWRQQTNLWLLGWGIGVGGVAVADQLSDDVLGTGPQIALYALGAALVATAAVRAVQDLGSGNPLAPLPSTYNGELRRDLRLAPDDVRAIVERPCR